MNAKSNATIKKELYGSDGTLNDDITRIIGNVKPKNKTLSWLEKIRITRK